MLSVRWIGGSGDVLWKIPDARIYLWDVTVYRGNFARYMQFLPLNSTEPKSYGEISIVILASYSTQGLGELFAQYWQFGGSYKLRFRERSSKGAPSHVSACWSEG